MTIWQEVLLALGVPVCLIFLAEPLGLSRLIEGCIILLLNCQLGNNPQKRTQIDKLGVCNLTLEFRQDRLSKGITFYLYMPVASK
ncbi:MAG: hypothetical protein KAI94_13780 [Anaerolineales bacterium]|nr:hypothetical protein [Anaerolineales bacterium]